MHEHLTKSLAILSPGSMNRTVNPGSFLSTVPGRALHHHHLSQGHPSRLHIQVLHLVEGLRLHQHPVNEQQVLRLPSPTHINQG